MRTANSLARDAVRASRRFDRLAQTMSSTSPTAAQSTMSARRIGPLTWAFRLVISVPNL